jgi:threonine dehydrogenase-like Zn-dependent dehydrogenase
MLALRRSASGIALEERDPPVRRSGEALLRVRMAGICNTDLELARGYMDFDGVLGHEFVADVVECDHAAWRGTRVAGEINLACGACTQCQRGLGRHCQQRSVLGILGKDGAFAEYVTLPLENLHRVPDGLSDQAACFIEPIAACYEITEQIQLEKYAQIAVLGDGKLGLLVALVLAERGATPVLVGKHERKLALARQHGIATAELTTLARKTFDLVVEATGSPSGLQQAITLLAPRGTLVLKSTYHGMLRLDAAPLVIDEITLIGSRCGPFAPAIAALAHRTLAPETLIDAVFPLADAEHALAKAAEPGVLKVILQMP